MISIVTVIHVFICVLLIILVLLQQGKGADVGATFGGSGNTFFGAGGADNLLTRVTTILAVMFMVTSLFLARGIRDTNTLEGSVVTGVTTSSQAENSSAGADTNSGATLVPTAPQPEAPAPGQESTEKPQETNESQPASPAQTQQQNE